jgi:hypothetical protein
MANEMRDRLVELIRAVQYLGGLEERLADHLIENGVIVPPCKVGDTLYTVGIYTGQIVKFPIYAITVYSDDTIFIMENTSYVSVKEHIGKTVFLTKSEAEQKLKEMRGADNG